MEEEAAAQRDEISDKLSRLGEEQRAMADLLSKMQKSVQRVILALPAYSSPTCRPLPRCSQPHPPHPAPAHHNQKVTIALQALQLEPAVRRRQAQMRLAVLVQAAHLQTKRCVRVYGDKNPVARQVHV